MPWDLLREMTVFCVGERLYDRFLTARGAEMARERREIVEAFYNALWREVTEGRTAGQKLLEEQIGTA